MRESNVGLYTTVTIVSVVLLGAFIALSVVIGEDFAISALLTGGVVGAIVLRGPLGKALAQRITEGAWAGGSAAGIARGDGRDAPPDGRARGAGGLHGAAPGPAAGRRACAAPARLKSVWRPGGRG